MLRRSHSYYYAVTLSLCVIIVFSFSMCYYSPVPYLHVPISCVKHLKASFSVSSVAPFYLPLCHFWSTLFLKFLFCFVICFSFLFLFFLMIFTCRMIPHLRSKVLSLLWQFQISYSSTCMADIF